MTIDVTIYRSEKDARSAFVIPFRKGMTVLDVLMHVYKHLDPSLAFRYECRQAICGTCGVMYNGTPVLSCSTQVDQAQAKHVIRPLSNFPVEKDLIVNLAPILERYDAIKPYIDNIHDVMLTKKDANRSKPFRKCIECGCCIAGSASVANTIDSVLDPMSLVKIARYITDPRDGINRKSIAKQAGSLPYSTEEAKFLSELCPRGVPIDLAVEILKK